MSCFGGRMKEYRNISIDRFDGLNLKSTVFMLSHCHSDHMVGLEKEVFIERLNSRNDIFLYCSEVTKILLLEKLPKLAKYTKTLSIGMPIVVPVPEQESVKTEDVTVTLIHASHCPGSVMFLFEGYDGTALYTGDFRWETEQVVNVQALHKDNRVKPVRSLYIDTTFCHPDSFFIPSRQACIDTVCELVKEWIFKGRNYVVHFTPRANYGHEPLLKEVANVLRCKVHVKEDKENIYNQISELRGVFTSVAMDTQVHACGGKCYGRKDRLPCDTSNRKWKVMVILPSTMFFTRHLNLDKSEIVVTDQGTYRVCYSFHSSMMEVRDLVTYLRPQRVYPNVKPPDDEDLSLVQKRLNDFLKLKHSSCVRHEEDSERPLGLLQPSIKKRQWKTSVSSDSQELFFGSQSFLSPKRKKIQRSPRKNRNVGSRLSFNDETCDGEDNESAHSSYAGSDHSDSELSGICESDDEKERTESLSTPPQSLLEAINSQCEDSGQSKSLSCRIIKYDDCEQTLEQPLSLEDIELCKSNKQSEDDSESEIMPEITNSCIEGDNKKGSKSGVITLNLNPPQRKMSEPLHIENEAPVVLTDRNDEEQILNESDLKFAEECLTVNKNVKEVEKSDVLGSHDLFEESTTESCMSSVKSSVPLHLYISPSEDGDISKSDDSQSFYSACTSQDQHICQTSPVIQQQDQHISLTSPIIQQQQPTSQQHASHCNSQSTQRFLVHEDQNDLSDSIEISSKQFSKSENISSLSPVETIDESKILENMREEQYCVKNETCENRLTIIISDDSPSTSQEKDKTDPGLHFTAKNQAKKKNIYLVNGGGEHAGARNEVMNGIKSSSVSETELKTNTHHSDIDDLFDLEDSDDEVEVVMETKVQGPENMRQQTDLINIENSDNYSDESDSDATLPPSQNSYQFSPFKVTNTPESYIRNSPRPGCLVKSTNCENKNTTPTKLSQSKIDIYCSPMKDLNSPQKEYVCSPSIEQRKRKSSGWLNSSKKKAVVISDGEKCGEGDKVVDLTLSSDEEVT